jgi:F420-0:gamma-glutamyl ligase
MEIYSIKTRLINPPKDDLIQAIIESKPNLKEGDILVVASKVVAIAEGRLVPREEPIKKL